MNAKHRIHPLKEKDVRLLERLTKGASNMRAHKIMESLFLMDDFRNFVQKIREREGINEDGKELPQDDHATFMEIHDFAMKYGEEINHYRENKKIFSFMNKSTNLDQFSAINRIIASYILYGEVFIPKNAGPGMMRIEPSPLPELSKVVFEFPISATKEEILSFVDANYNRKGSNRIKPWELFARDIFIYSQYLDLLENKPSRKKGDYREKRLTNELKALGIDIKQGNTGDVIKRVAKRRKIANESM